MTDLNPTPIVGYFRDDAHALKTGFLIGAMMTAGITVRPETDDRGNYTSKLIIELPRLEELGPPAEVWIRVLAGPDAI